MSAKNRATASCVALAGEAGASIPIAKQCDQRRRRAKINEETSLDCCAPGRLNQLCGPGLASDHADGVHAKDAAHAMKRFRADQ